VSLDFNAAFAIGPGYHGKDWLRDELAREADPIRRVVGRYRHRWRAKTWEVERGRDEMVNIVGPGGFAFTISACAVSLYHLLPFRVFTSDEAQRDLLRGACAAIAELLGSPRVIYVHELVMASFYGGIDLDGIEADLRAKFGAPAATFEALDAAENFGSGCWYVEQL